PRLRGRAVPTGAALRFCRSTLRSRLFRRFQLGHEQPALSRTRRYRDAMLTVLSVAYPFAPVGPDAVGGAEQILSRIDQALVAAGHRSLVIACAGSRMEGELLQIPAPPSDTIDDAVRASTHTAARRVLAANLPWVDVVHLHCLDFHAYLPPPGKPVLITLHLPPDWYSSLAIERP